ncbi:unnamed protein product [Protopolystoma xenopodis]|uniref:Uncharacterized protein n=1 Tax=Protopolystoma xenopodis TaxID=117903 RepID=A0A448WH99_9PLAT|nr:unnamed protein product [Protopolystoma xenopodis]
MVEVELPATLLWILTPKLDLLSRSDAYQELAFRLRQQGYQAHLISRKKKCMAKENAVVKATSVVPPEQGQGEVDGELKVSESVRPNSPEKSPLAEGTGTQGLPIGNCPSASSPVISMPETVKPTGDASSTREAAYDATSKQSVRRAVSESREAVSTSIFLN